MGHTLHLDAIINMAKSFTMHSMIEIDHPLIERLLNVNLMGSLFVHQVFFDILNSPKGRIIDCSSEG